MKKTWMRLTSAALSATVLVSSLGLPVLAADSTVKKNETVYIITDAAGSADEIIVSDWLENLKKAGSIKDSSDLTDIQVVKGDAEMSGSGSSITWSAGGEDVYYQGTSNKSLPVGVTFTYQLDGKTVSPDELAGKSGKLTITIAYTNSAKETVTVDGKKETMYVPFLMATGILLSSDCVSNVSVDHGMVENDGDNTIILGYGLPGLSESLKLDELAKSDDEDSEEETAIETPEIPDTVTITADVTDFSMEMAVTVATNSVLDKLDLDGTETRDELEDSLTELQDAARSWWTAPRSFWMAWMN
jgi:putative membrane protein